jgi:hypothetical protein
MVLDWLYYFLRKSGKLLVFTSLLINTSLKAQVESSSGIQLENEEFEQESIEHNEELNLKRRAKVDILEFINDDALNALLLNKQQLIALKNHIKSTGNIIDLLELQSLGDFTYQDYLRIQELVSIHTEESLASKTKFTFLQRYSYQSNKINNALGSQWANYQLVKIRLQHQTNIGFAREFDVGENTNKSALINHYDHYAYYIQKKWAKAEIILGNYQVYHGFGLLIGQGYSSSVGNGGINNLIQNRWTSNANQTELNTMHGVAYSKQFKSMQLNIGWNKQLVDEGSQTGLHRTNTELARKNKLAEQTLLVGLERSTRKFKQSVIILNNQVDKQYSISSASQFYIRNATLFSEVSFHEHQYAYTFGSSLMISKLCQLSISHTYFSTAYASNWASASTQGFNENDGKGILLHTSFPIRRKWIVNISHKGNISINKNNRRIGQNNSQTQSIRIDRNFSKQVNLSTILLYRYRLEDADKTEQISKESKETKARIVLRQSMDEQYQQELQVYLNHLNSHYSKGLAYQLKYKTKGFAIFYSIGVFEIYNGLPIYFSSSSTIVLRNSVAVYNNSAVQNIGLQLRLKKKILIAMQLNNQYNSVERTNQYKVQCNVKYQ